MKKQFRADIRKRRDELTKKEIKEKSSIIKDRLFSLPEYKKAKKIVYYASFGSEVDTHDMIKESLSSKKIVVPKVKGHELVLSRIHSFDELSHGKYNILEPSEIREIDEKKVDVIIVPGVVFDKKGYRIGYGKGYYDKLLHRFGHAVKIGLAFDMQIVDSVPKEEHDIKMDIVITEKRVMIF